MFEYNSKINKKVANLWDPLLDRLHLRWGISPNVISWISFCVGFVAAVAFSFKAIEIALLLVTVSLLLDSIDGSMARRFGMVTEYGRMLDTILDRTNETLLLLALVVTGQISARIAFLAVTSYLLVTLVKNKSMFDPGFKRVMILAGWVVGYQLAIEISFLANMMGFVISLVILDYRKQVVIDRKEKK